MANIEVKMTKTIGGSFIVERKETAKLTQEDIDDIMCSALEGGITYWCDKVEVVENRYYGEWAHEQISRGGNLKIHDFEDNEEHFIGLDDFIEGMALALKDGYGENWFVNGALDGSQIDAEMADVIIQFAIWGEVVYG